MEVKRNYEPKNNFLQEIRKLTKKNKIILIFDECTSGFRETLGGLHKKYKVEPDMAIFGKALGNGYPINAIIGKSKLMSFANKTFISSTFLSEGLGPTAAIETIKLMDKKKTYKYILKTGKQIKNNWTKISKKTGVEIEVFGLDCIPKFKFLHKDSNFIKTIFTYEMLKKGFLAGNAIYVSTAHTEKILKRYYKITEQIFYKIAKLIKDKNYKKIYPIKESMTDFGRLN